MTIYPPQAPRPAQRQFAVGDRVVVVNSAYDKPKISEYFGPMDGHYGKVAEIHTNDVDPGYGPRLLVGVEIMGRIDNLPVQWPSLERHGLGDRARTWYFYDTELEHAD